MSTATIAAGNVRPLSAIKADMANALANKPESILADAKAALTWLPAKAYETTIRALRWLHVPQALAFVRVNFNRFIGVVGKGPFAVEMLTSHWGQKTILKALGYGGKVVGFGLKWSWKILTSPMRLFSPTRNGIERVEAGIATVNAKFTPDSGETFGPLQIARDILGYNLSADRAPIKFARITAVAVMAVRTTRRFAPAGWMRVAAYILDGLIIGRAYDNALADTWLGKKITDRFSRQSAVIEADIVSAGENASAEASRLTREAAEKSATKLRRKAETVEASAAAAAEAELIKAAELRQEADAMEATAERMAAAETASAVTESLQTEAAATEAHEAAAAVLTAERPKPGPSVPPLGGRSPSSGPQNPQHQQHGGRQTPRKR